jgi:hypothetical protein
MSYVATLALGSRPRQGVARLRESRGKKPGSPRKEAREQRQRHWKGAGQEEEARESSHTPRSLRKCEGV